METRRTRHGCARAAIASILVASAVEAQEPAATSEPDAVWELFANVFYSDPPGSEDRLTPILYADHGPLHLEARYNYEDLETLSIFAGWSFELGAEKELAGEITPMLGAAVGDTEGIIPAVELDLGWRRFALYSEAEYLFDCEDRDEDFFYSWSTLTYALTEQLSAGIVAERSKLVDTDHWVQRGVALEVTFAIVGVALYAYNLGSDDFYAVVALEFGL